MNTAPAPAPERVEVALRHWLDEHGVASYDPYDGLDCGPPWSLVKRSRLVARLWTQTIKRSPLNLRPLVGIQPHVSAKSLADLAAAALLRQRLGGDPGAGATARELLGALRLAVLPGHRGACWGMPTAYVSRYIAVEAQTPNLFWSVVAAQAFLEAFEMEGDRSDLGLARSVADFIRGDLGGVDEGDGGVWFRYFAHHEAAVYNVTALAGAFLLRLSRHTGESDLASLGRRALHFVLQHQNGDGSWDYARGLEGRWVDGFHSGYVLEALLQAVLLESNPQWEAALRRGVRFYHEQLFTADHLPRYLAGRLHPIEVQNCAQAIQTLALLCWWDAKELERAQAVTQAVTGLLFRFTRQGSEEAGYFLLSRGRFVTNPLPAVRWGQAPMLLALTHLRAAAAGLRPAWESAEPRA